MTDDNNPQPEQQPPSEHNNISSSMQKSNNESSQGRPILSYVLWLCQGLLALLFLLVGSMKLILPIDVMPALMPVELPALFVRFIGVAEVLGAIGLLLPGLLNIREELTLLAAAGIVIIMSGATVLTLVSGDVGPALVPVIVGFLAVFVAYGRWRLRPFTANTL